MDKITIRGARTHNLKSIDLDIPRDKLIVITGLSGSGKSSLAFDTLYAEGQRRYVESLSTYARQFLSVMEKPEVDLIEGLSPAISIEQKTTSHNPRSTVGTVTEIYDYLRLLYARVGQPMCPEHDTPLNAQTISQMVERVLQLPEGTKVMLLAPLIADRKGEHQGIIDKLRQSGFIRVRLNGEVYTLEDLPKRDPKKKHTLEVVIDRIKVHPDIALRLSESFESAIEQSGGMALIELMDTKEEVIFSSKHACTQCGYSCPELEPKLFSFNSPAGACPTCDGLGMMQHFDEHKILHQPALSLPMGAIRGWDRRSPYYFQILESLSRHYGFDIDKPFEKLPKKIQAIILHGSGDEDICFEFKSDSGRSSTREAPFEGVLPNFERRFRETTSDHVREELAAYLTNAPCTTCKGSRLRKESRHVFVAKKSLSDVTNLSIAETFNFFNRINFKGTKAPIAEKILREIKDRLSFLINVGLEYLSLSRTADTLSGGESQRIRLASQIGAGLVGVMYVLDEPSIGLHQRDNDRLLKTLEHLRNIGNTVIVVEHDYDAILAADHVIDIGPGAGVHGGEVIAQGTPEQIKESKGLTGDYLSGRREIATPKKRVAPGDTFIIIEGASGNNLQEVTAKIPLGLFTCITGVSGSGKSTLINDTLAPMASHLLNRADLHAHSPCKQITGLEHCDKVVCIDQSPIGRTPRSNAATYTGLFTHIRDLFANTQEARSRGYKTGRFSFNVKGGRCEACEGDGLIKVEMHFLADLYVTCDVCHGKRYNDQTLEVLYKGKSIAEVLDMTVEDAIEFFEPVPPIRRKCETLRDVGLSYIKIGQSATTLSGGEAQRIKLSRELSKRDTGHTLYILDEPTTGLHFHDIKQLLEVLSHLKKRGNTILVIEHNLDVIKTADWIIDLGPEGGNKGGRIIAEGTPETVASTPGSYTGQYLKPLLPNCK